MLITLAGDAVVQRWCVVTPFKDRWDLMETFVHWYQQVSVTPGAHVVMWARVGPRCVGSPPTERGGVRLCVGQVWGVQTFCVLMGYTRPQRLDSVLRRLLTVGGGKGWSVTALPQHTLPGLLEGTSGAVRPE